MHQYILCKSPITLKNHWYASFPSVFYQIIRRGGYLKNYWSKVNASSLRSLGMVRLVEWRDETRPLYNTDLSAAGKPLSTEGYWFGFHYSPGLELRIEDMKIYTVNESWEIINERSRL